MGRCGWRFERQWGGTSRWCVCDGEDGGMTRVLFVVGGGLFGEVWLGGMGGLFDKLSFVRMGGTIRQAFVCPYGGIIRYPFVRPYGGIIR